MGNNGSHAVILYVEDEEYDVLFMRRAFTKAGLTYDLRVATDGQKAIEYLSDGQPRPDLVLLDLNLPLVSGFDVLKWMRQQEKLKDIPVVIFSSSARQEDRARAQELGANEYVQKPGSALDFTGVITVVTDRWLKSGA